MPLSYTDTPETKAKLCLLCDGTEKHTWNKFHVKNGLCYKPEKGHKDYELHLRMVKLLHI